MTKVARSARQRRSAWIPWAFVGGFAYLVWTMGTPRDGWDDGARL